MIKTSLPEAMVGVTIQDVNSGKILYEYHGSKYFIPASTTKLFTAAAALWELGPDYTFDTSLYLDKKDRIAALKFSGDPSLKLSHIHSLIKKLQQAQITEIQDLIVDDSVFEGPLIGTGWTWDSTPWYYSAPVSAIVIDNNQFGVTLFPAKELGGKVEVVADAKYPNDKPKRINSDVKGVTYQDSETICQLEVKVHEDNAAEFSGCWPVGESPVNLQLAILNPRKLSKDLLTVALRNAQIELKGQIKFEKIPDNFTKLAHHESKPLHTLLGAVLADSNNLYAESLTKTLGAELFGKGSFKTGTLAIKQILSEITGIEFEQTRLTDGSGSSRYNLLSPLHLSRLLYTTYNEKKLGPYFRDALSLSGVNGTLKKRMASFDTKANVQAKTGTLNGVSALSGYLTTRSGQKLIVTIMVNQSTSTPAEMKQFENDLCYFVVNQF